MDALVGDDSFMLPNAAPPGALAESRVGAETFQQIRRAQGIEIVTFTPLARRRWPWRGNVAVEWQENITVCPAGQAVALAGRLADLLREDRLYIGERGELTGPGDVALVLSNPLPDIRVTLFLKEHRIRLACPGEFVGRVLLLDPIGEALLDLIRNAAPEDSRVHCLEFSALPPPASPTLPVHIPPELWNVARSVQPGMRRLDVLRLWQEEGGLQGRFQQSFVHPGEVNDHGESRKVEVRFVPATTAIRWLDGIGYPVDMPPAYTLALEDVQGSDIVVAVSEPFLECCIY